MILAGTLQMQPAVTNSQDGRLWFAAAVLYKWLTQTQNSGVVQFEARLVSGHRFSAAAKGPQ